MTRGSDESGWCSCSPLRVLLLALFQLIAQAWTWTVAEIQWTDLESKSWGFSCCSCCYCYRLTNTLIAIYFRPSNYKDPSCKTKPNKKWPQQKVRQNQLGGSSVTLGDLWIIFSQVSWLLFLLFVPRNSAVEKERESQDNEKTYKRKRRASLYQE